VEKIQNHWRSVVGTVLVLALASILVWQSAVGGVALADDEDPPYEPLSKVRRDAILSVLDNIGLDRDALTGLNLSGEQAVELLGDVRTWQGEQAGTLASLQATIDQKVTAVRQARLAIAMGPAQEGQDEVLAAALEDLSDARASYASAFSSLRSTINISLSPSQDTAWAAMNAGRGQNLPFRIVAQTHQQRLDLNQAWRHYRLRQAAASTADERQAAISAWQTALGRIFTVDQAEILDAFYTHYASAAGAVTSAYESVLAVEEA